MRFEIIVPIVLALSFLFAIGGVGSATAIVPLLVILGEEINNAKNAGLFVNVLSSSSSIHHHHARGHMEWSTALTVAIPAFFLAPSGAILSQYMSHKLLLGIFAAFLIYSGTMLLTKKSGDVEQKTPGKIVLGAIGALSGFFAGMLGIGGGSLVSPLLAHLGMDAKRIARITPLTVFLSSLSGFLTYTLMGHFDIYLLAAVSIPAIIGGYAGAHIMHSRLSPRQVKAIIGIIFYILAVKAVITIM